MASIRLTQFAGLMPELSAKLKRKDNAQIAHNCLLYDGRLRAMPAYMNYQTYPSGQVLSLYTAASNVLPDVYPDFEYKDAIFIDGAPFPRGVYGYNQFTVVVKFGNPGISGNNFAAPIGPVNIITESLNVSPFGLTARPTVVSYAITLVRLVGSSIEESAPALIGTVGQAAFQPLYYDGDAVQIFVQLAGVYNGENRARIYRTITGIETGEQLTNPFDTDWFLVVDIPINGFNPVISYTDIATSSQLQGDLLLSEGNLPPLSNNPPVDVGITEGGWFWFATKNDIQFSERYHWHAWSISGFLKLPDKDVIKGAVTFYDTVYIGTAGKPYKATVAFSNEDVGNVDPINVNLAPYPEFQPCLDRTIVTAPFGALYTSRNGIIALEDSGMQVLTKDLLSAGDSLYEWCDNGVEKELHFADITYAAWFNGWYIGYAGDKAFVYQAPENLNDAHPFQQLITMDVPDTSTIRPCSVVGSYGLHFAVGQAVYYWPVPGWVRDGDTPTKLRYKWKSKKFVMPGTTNFAAAKVVWDCDGEVCFRFFSDCRQVFECKVTDCQPFRLPTNITGVEFEIELEGTGTVSEAHVASSMHELIEVETE